MKFWKRGGGGGGGVQCTETVHAQTAHGKTTKTALVCA